MTFPGGEAQLPRLKVRGAGFHRIARPLAVTYRRGAAVGYRWFAQKGETPLFPFGFGLGYTTFTLGDLAVVVDGAHAEAALDVTNTGARAGAAVPQVYVAGPEGSGVGLRLAGFGRVELAPARRAGSRSPSTRASSRPSMSRIAAGGSPAPTRSAPASTRRGSTTRPRRSFPKATCRRSRTEHLVVQGLWVQRPFHGATGLLKLSHLTTSTRIIRCEPSTSRRPRPASPASSTRRSRGIRDHHPSRQACRGCRLDRSGGGRPQGVWAQAAGTRRLHEDHSVRRLRAQSLTIMRRRPVCSALRCLRPTRPTRFDAAAHQAANARVTRLRKALRRGSVENFML